IAIEGLGIDRGAKVTQHIGARGTQRQAGNCLSIRALILAPVLAGYMLAVDADAARGCGG
ncbi:MAG: hypothetical protein V2I82_06670, partial [Halieaceae bacterium]|nr:hypothetical protein [Halieaceae bacterium]